jgi:hypothetical protein
MFLPWNPADPSRLLLAPSALEMRGPERHRGIALDELAGYLEFPDGARTLVAADGNTIHVEPGAWRGSEEVIGRLDTYVADELRVPMDSRPAEEIWQPPHGWRRVWAQLLHLLAGREDLVFAGIFLCVLSAVGVWRLQHGEPVGVAIIAAGVVLSLRRLAARESRVNR